MQISIALRFALLMTLMTGVAYPLAITAVGQSLFPHTANGSLLKHHSVVLGSELVGQDFHSPHYFWGRPSATAPFAYNPNGSAGSNLSIASDAYVQLVTERKVKWDAIGGNHGPIPVDLVTASASGLDPHISPAAASYQAPRIARLRSLPQEAVQQLIQSHTQEPLLGILGSRRVNVLQLNLALDALALQGAPSSGP